MRHRVIGSLCAIGLAVAVVWFVQVPASGQAFYREDAKLQPGAKTWFAEKAKLPPYTPPRLPNGDPDFRGSWRGNGNATDMLEEHGYIDITTPPQESFIFDPADGKIPYQPWALKARDANRAGLARGWPGETGERLYADPQALCLTTVPRYAYRGNVVINQSTPGVVVMTMDWGHYYRVIPIDGRPHSGSTVKTWMGESVGHFENGRTLVIDTINLNGKMWLDSIGDFYTSNVHITERWTMVGPDTVEWSATFEDPTAYTRPWSMVFPQKRNRPQKDDPSALEAWEHACWEGEHDAPHLKAQGFKWFDGEKAPK